MGDWALGIGDWLMITWRFNLHGLIFVGCVTARHGCGEIDTLVNAVTHHFGLLE